MLNIALLVGVRALGAVARSALQAGMPTPLEELPDIQLDDEEEEAGDVRWRPLWQQSLERMSTSSSKP